jgi:hypothetical protein
MPELLERPISTLPEFCQATCELGLPRAALSDMNGQLRLLGFRESMINPDLGGLATEIRVEQGLA